MKKLLSYFIFFFLFFNIEGKDEFNKISKVKIIPENAKCINYAFDVTPAKYITKLITEKGIVEPNKDSINTLK